MKYEFYVYINEGDETWNWDLKDYKKVVRDIKENKSDKSFSVEIQRWFGEGDFDYVEIYPTNHTNQLPNYVKKYTDKVLTNL